MCEDLTSTSREVIQKFPFPGCSWEVFTSSLPEYAAGMPQWNHVFIRLMDKSPGGLEVARFKLTRLEGNGNILISHDTSVRDIWRGRGIGRVMMKLKKAICIASDSISLMATVADTNEAENRLLCMTGWANRGAVTPTARIWTWTKGANE